MHCLLMVTGRCFGWQRLNYAQCIAGTPPSACVMKEKNAIDCFSRCTVLSVPCCLTVSALRQTWERGSAYLGDSVSHSPTPAPADAKTKPPASLTVMERRSAEIPTALGGRKASLQPPSTVRSNWLPHARLCSKKQLRVGAARRLCSGDRPGRSTWLDRYVLALLTSAGRAELPPPAREAGPSWPRRACQTSKRSPVAGSDDAEGGRAASGRCGGFAQSCGRCRFFDRGRSNRCWRHQQASCGRLYCVQNKEASPTSTPWINQAS